MIEQNPNIPGMSAIADVKGFSEPGSRDGDKGTVMLLHKTPSGGGKLYKMNASGKSDNAKANAQGQIYQQYPFPPASCADAMIMITNIQNDITARQQLVATSAASGNLEGRYVTALQAVLLQFQTYVTNNQCAANATAADNQAFSNQVLDALNQEQGTATQKTTTSNWLIYGGIGLVLITALLLITRKRSKS